MHASRTFLFINISSLNSKCHLQDSIFNGGSDDDVSSDEVMSEIPNADANDSATVEVEDFDTATDSAALFGSAADACVTEISVTIRESIEDISAAGNDTNISGENTFVHVMKLECQSRGKFNWEIFRF